jgi:protein-disulfide isomerase
MTTHATHLESPIGERDHTFGRAEAAVTLVEYGHFACFYCAQAYPVVKAVRAHFGDRLRFAFRHAPQARSNPEATLAGEAAEAAAAQGKFWQMHDRLFEGHPQLDRATLVAHARAIELDVARFERDLDAHTFAAQLLDEERTGVHSVRSTPTFFINGLRYEDTSDEHHLVTALAHAFTTAARNA